MAGTGEPPEKVWVLSEYVDDAGHNICDVLKVFGTTEAALAAYLEMTIDEEDAQAEARENFEANRSVLFTAVRGGECVFKRVTFVGPMSGGRSRRKRKTTRRRKH